MGQPFIMLLILLLSLIICPLQSSLILFFTIVSMQRPIYGIDGGFSGLNFHWISLWFNLSLILCRSNFYIASDNFCWTPTKFVYLFKASSNRHHTNIFGTCFSAFVAEFKLIVCPLSFVQFSTTWDYNWSFSCMFLLPWNLILVPAQALNIHQLVSSKGQESLSFSEFFV